MKRNIHFPILYWSLAIMAVLCMPHLAMSSGSFDGEWKIEDSANKMTGKIHLQEQGSKLQGTAVFSRGTARVEGSRAGQEIHLLLIYDNVAGLTNFVSEKTAQQILGITSRLILQAGGNPDRLEGKVLPWQIAWDNQQNVTQRYEGGSSEANRLNPPRDFRLVRAQSATVSTDPQRPMAWADLIRSGRGFRVAFDVAPSKFNDEGWLGDRDPMGTLKGGETYTVSYNPANQEWKVTGFNEKTNGVGTWSYNGGAAPESCQLTLWGRVFMFTKEGKVIDLDYGWVGHLRE